MTNSVPDIGFRKGDDGTAFNKHDIRVRFVKTEDEGEISRMDFVCGCICKSYPNPVSPFYVDFTPEETAKLRYINVGYLVAYDEQGRQETCIGCIKFTIKNGVICKC